MTTDPDPFEQGQRAARKAIPAEGNPYQDGTEQHALWASGHEQVRINYNDGRPAAVAGRQLQPKGDRYYFLRTFPLARGAKG